MFGRSVALTGDTALVGAYLDNVGANTNQASPRPTVAWLGGLYQNEMKGEK